MWAYQYCICAISTGGMLLENLAAEIRIAADCTSAEQQADELRGKYLLKYILITYGCNVPSRPASCSHDNKQGRPVLLVRVRAARRSRLQSAQQASLPEIC